MVPVVRIQSLIDGCSRERKRNMTTSSQRKTEGNGRKGLRNWVLIVRVKLRETIVTPFFPGLRGHLDPVIFLPRMRTLQRPEPKNFLLQRPREFQGPRERIQSGLTWRNAKEWVGWNVKDAESGGLLDGHPLLFLLLLLSCRITRTRIPENNSAVQLPPISGAGNFIYIPPKRIFGITTYNLSIMVTCSVQCPRKVTVILNDGGGETFSGCTVKSALYEKEVLLLCSLNER
ncbi:hypothetical protein E2C01_046791 [Portunus trituberculatus]|uniref:Uncharacterized protein n=1 Tax=Portunus trituberculatus TaxID=210409 RepID=A0A5B7FYQ1_PORTR|nr:hypothetical protein [Portunus trituberculatus]